MPRKPAIIAVHVNAYTPRTPGTVELLAYEVRETPHLNLRETIEDEVLAAAIIPTTGGYDRQEYLDSDDDRVDQLPPHVAIMYRALVNSARIALINRQSTDSKEQAS